MLKYYLDFWHLSNVKILLEANAKIITFPLFTAEHETNGSATGAVSHGFQSRKLTHRFENIYI